jgi:hypothetical protein
MADSTQPTPNIGGNGFFWVLVAAVGTYFVVHPVPLEDSRPPTAERPIQEQVGAQDVDARLWQDPFAAVAAVLSRSPDFKPENCEATKLAKLNKEIQGEIQPHCPPPLIDEAGPPSRVLVASVTGAAYSEDHEF